MVVLKRLFLNINSNVFLFLFLLIDYLSLQTSFMVYISFQASCNPPSSTCSIENHKKAVQKKKKKHKKERKRKEK